MTFDPHKATNDELRDWVARKIGWSDDCDSAFFDWFKGDRKSPECEYSEDHPIPFTLDAIAALMPEGWTWWKKPSEGKTEWYAYVPRDAPRFRKVWCDDTAEEKRDRLLLAVLCMMATEPKGGEEGR